MKRILVPSAGPSSWRDFVADPERQWREERSAFELAVDWEAERKSERGLPAAVAQALDTVAELRGARVVIALPEHQVALDGGGHPSQTDLWVLLDAPAVGLISMAVEGKAGEPFDRMVTEWEKGTSEGSGKPARLRQLCGLLGITEEQARQCRYQLLHRAAAAILEARRFHAPNAMLLVQSFPGPEGTTDESTLADFQCFAKQLAVTAGRNQVVPAGDRGGVKLWLGWVSAPVSTDSATRAAAREAKE